MDLPMLCSELGSRVVTSAPGDEKSSSGKLFVAHLSVFVGNLSLENQEVLALCVELSKQEICSHFTLETWGCCWEALSFRRASSTLNQEILSTQVLLWVRPYIALTWKLWCIGSLTYCCCSLLILSLHSWGFCEWPESVESVQHPINLWTPTQKYIFSHELCYAKSLLIFMMLPAAWEPVSPGKLIDRHEIKHLVFSQLSWSFPSPGSRSPGKRISRSVAKNDDNTTTTSQSLVQFHFTNQSYTKE